MKARTNIRTLQAMFLALFLITLTACGGGGSAASVSEGDAPPAGPVTVPLTATAIQLAQDALDVITRVIDSSNALLRTQLAALQTIFDGFINTLSSDADLTAGDIQTVQDALDDYTGTTDASAGALTAADIARAQDALDAARSLL